MGIPKAYQHRKFREKISAPFWEILYKNTFFELQNLPGEKNWGYACRCSYKWTKLRVIWRESHGLRAKKRVSAGPNAYKISGKHSKLSLQIFTPLHTSSTYKTWWIKVHTNSKVLQVSKSFFFRISDPILTQCNPIWAVCFSKNQRWQCNMLIMHKRIWHHYCHSALQ